MMRSTKHELPRPPRAVVRSDGGAWTLQTVLHRKGLGPVAGVDEAGRGACAGPLVVAACVLRPADALALAGLTDSKLLSAARREYYHDLIVARALSRSVVVIPPDDIDELGLHMTNLEGMRRAVAGLSVHPGYVLTDGFRVSGLTAPNMAVIGGDRAAACVSAASVLAKVTRDRIMTELHARVPWYGFAEHKGYCTPEHTAALLAHGPCAEHRFSYANVALAARLHGLSASGADTHEPAESLAGRGPEWRIVGHADGTSGRSQHSMMRSMQRGDGQPPMPSMSLR